MVVSEMVSDLLIFILVKRYLVATNIYIFLSKNGKKWKRIDLKLKRPWMI